MLNPSQEKAVEHFGRPLLVIAGAGSGKTKTITHKVEHIIKVHKIDPKKILVITFTNKAGEELKKRIRQKIGIELKNVGTFHSFALGILKNNYRLVGYKSYPTVLDEGDKNSILKSILKLRDYDPKFLDKVKLYISSKLEALSTHTDNSLENIVNEYLQILKEKNYVDFSTMLFFALEIIKSEPRFWRESFDYILVDEFQDTNTIQYEIIRMLARQNICVVGDPNQCIYEWRYAKPDNVIKFMEDFNPDIIKLEDNYRSTKAIISLANAILENSRAPWKKLIPKLRTQNVEGEKPLVKEFQNEEAEALWIAGCIKELKRYYNYGDIAILVRVGYVTNTIERVLNYNNIPYSVVGQVRFFERSEIKDILAFLRLLVNPNDSIAFERSIRVASRGIGEESIRVIKELNKDNYLVSSLDAIRLRKLRPTVAQNLYEFLQKLKKLKNGLDRYYESLRLFLESINFWEYLANEYKKDYQERYENVNELLRYIEQKYEEGYTLDDLVSDVSLNLDKDEQGDRVQLMTIHASKGLEFPIVFLPRFEDGILPHDKKIYEGNIEEELRLFYVAVTRTKEKLYVSYVKDATKKPSRFLTQIPKNLLNMDIFSFAHVKSDSSIKRNYNSNYERKTSYMPELSNTKKISIGARVLHKLFGEGVVVAICDERVTVRFKNAEKNIHSAFLEVIE